MNISVEGVGNAYVGLMQKDSVVGQVCKLVGKLQVGACSAGDKFFGVTMAVKDGGATVLYRGFAKVRYSGTAPEVGYRTLSADGAGGVKVDSAGQGYWIVEKDAKDKSIVILL